MLANSAHQFTYQFAAVPLNRLLPLPQVISSSSKPRRTFDRAHSPRRGCFRTSWAFRTRRR